MASGTLALLPNLASGTLALLPNQAGGALALLGSPRGAWFFKAPLNKSSGFLRFDISRPVAVKN
jgi:hypothetical protein